MHRFLKALPSVEMPNEEVEIESSRATSGALYTTHLENAVLFSADDYDVVLKTGTAAAHTRAQRAEREI